MWVGVSGIKEKHRGVYFQYNQSRSGKTAEKLWSGYKGVLETDGYAGYNNIPEITHAECWAHCRRYFMDSMPIEERKKNPEKKPVSYGYKGVEYCNKLFEIERELAEKSAEEKQKIRQEKSKLIVDAFFGWAKETLASTLTINKKLNEALTYATNQEKELREFLNDGRIPLDNSLAERTIRPFAVHRKNWLFADTIEGAKANAVYYSLIESAKINKLNIHKYIEYLLTHISQMDNPKDKKKLEKYLPWSEELPEEVRNCEVSEDEFQSDLIVC